MSLVLPILYHWSPERCRKSILRNGLRPSCPTASRFDAKGQPVDDDDEGSFLAVCLGTSPSHAWCLSGDLLAGYGDTWDLWQVVLDDDDEVHPLPFQGYRLDEIRVANRIPKSQIWHVGSRTVNDRRRKRWRETNDNKLVREQ